MLKYLSIIVLGGMVIGCGQIDAPALVLKVDGEVVSASDADATGATKLPDDSVDPQSGVFAEFTKKPEPTPIATPISDSGDVTPDIPTLPTFPEIPGDNSNPTNTPTPSPTDVKPDNIKYGVNLDMSCEQYVQKNWKIGAHIDEVAPGPLFTEIKFSTTVTDLKGTTVTIKTFTDAPGTADDSTGVATFDACIEGYRTAIPSTIAKCPVTEVGFETIKVNGVSYKSRKLTMGECIDANGKTFSSTVWRVAELPLWGIVKREVSGTMFPDSVNNKLSPVSKTWGF